MAGLDEEAIFQSARQIDRTDARRLYLDQACGPDAGLRARLDALLRAHDEERSFLERPALPPAAPGPETTTLTPVEDDGPPPAIGARIGPYKLLQQLGEGGMGTVYLAEQTDPVRRQVALKVIKPGMDSRQVLARFEAERQALALMDHVNIARVFDGGMTGPGRPYFVMEVVRGVPITRYCDDNHLTPRQRLELFVPVCQAVQHAHQKGVIHRDIKPSNVLVTLYDGKPVPKVIDFGVAKATEQKLTDRTLFTQFGGIVGTLEYMSPEQAETSALGVDTRSDVYSLGVLLYELLTGTTPLNHNRMKQAAFAEIIRLIKEEDPPRPSTRLSDSGEALASISAQRQMEPAKLTRLVRGELDWIVMKCLEKDRGRRYETANCFAQDVQRYLADEPVLAVPPAAGYRLRKFARRNRRSLLTAALLAFALLVAVGAVAGSLAWASRDRAARQAAVEQEVDVALGEAERWAEQGTWPEALSAAKRAEGLVPGGERRGRVRQLCTDLEMVMRLEEIRLLSSDVKDDKFENEVADRSYQQAFAAYDIDVLGLPAGEAAGRLRARTRVAAALVAALDHWASCRGTKDRAGALALTELAQAADPDPWRRQVRDAFARQDWKALTDLATSLQQLRRPPTDHLFASAMLRAGGLWEARLAVLRLAQQRYPGDFWVNFQLATALSLIPARRDEGVAFYRAALACRPQSKAAHMDLGIALKGQGKLDEAIACHRRAIEVDPNSAKAHNNLGLSLRAQGNLGDAIVAYRRAIELDPTNAKAHMNLGNVLGDRAEWDEAVATHRRAVALDPTAAATHSSLSTALQLRYRASEAREPRELDEAVACHRRAVALDPEYATVHFNLGNALMVQDKLDQAIAHFRKATELDPNYADAHTNLGIALMSQGKTAEAAGCYRKAIEADPKHALALNNLGRALRAERKLPDASVTFGGPSKSRRRGRWRTPGSAMPCSTTATSTAPTPPTARPLSFDRNTSVPTTTSLLL